MTIREPSALMAAIAFESGASIRWPTGAPLTASHTCTASLLIVRMRLPSALYCARQTPSLAWSTSRGQHCCSGACSESVEYSNTAACGFSGHECSACASNATPSCHFPSPSKRCTASAKSALLAACRRSVCSCGHARSGAATRLTAIHEISKRPVNVHRRFIRVQKSPKGVKQSLSGTDGERCDKAALREFLAGGRAAHGRIGILCHRYAVPRVRGGDEVRGLAPPAMIVPALRAFGR